jgi:Lamin Tail Domain/Immunoglobulin domain
MAAIWLLLFVGVARAAVVPGLYPTGLDDLRTPLPSGTTDPHWELVESPDAQFPGPAAWVVNEGFPIPPWVDNDGTSKWIGPRADAGDGTAPGNYVYRLRFSLDEFDPPTTVLTGRWASDNSGVEVRLNGQSVGLANEGGFTQFTAPFEITTGFVDGTNILEFVVNNAGDGANPSGFRAEVSATADPAPGPGTPPTLTAQPSDVSASPGEEARFSVSARGGRPLNYQWRFNGFPLARATNALLTIPTVSESWVGEYSVRVANPWGSVTSRVARLTLGYRSARTRRLEPPGPSSRRSGIAFSEIHYEPAPSADPRNREFVELYNSNPFVEDLSGWRLTGEWDITLPPGTLLPARSYLVIAADPQAIREIHGITNVVGGTTQRLNNAGGTLRLRKPSGGIVLELEYRPTDPWPVAAAGFGPSLVPARPSLGEADPAAWRASTRVGGSPGTADPDPESPLDGVVINEVVRNPVGAQQPFVELFNPAPFARDLSGGLLRAGTNAPLPIAPGTILGPGGWIRIGTAGWVWSEDRIPVVLYDAEQVRVIDAVEVPGQLPGTSAGRSPDGSPDWRSLVLPTPAAANSAVRISEIAINEVHYHPAGDGEAEEFVELLNRGTETIALAGWQLRRGIQFVFPQGTLLAPGQAIAVAADAALLRLRNPGVPADRIIGNFTGNLSDGGEALELTRPALQSIVINGVPATRPVNVPVERFAWRDGGRWSRWADGNGSSLERIDPRADPEQPGSWQASDETTRAPWTLVEITATADLSHPSVPTADQLQILLLGEGEALIDDIEVIAGGR